jgi:hypothetical protein
MNINRRAAWTVSFLTATFGLGSLTWAEPLRDGSGTHRALLDKMELKPFPGDAWSKLTDWQNGELAEGLTKDKVVLILAYNDYSPSPKRAFAVAQRLATAHASAGLIVVAAHSARGWEDAAKPKVEDGSLRIAHDAKGEFRTVLQAESDPDFYMIDRSGQLRYAGLATESVEEAVTKLLAETPAQAGATRAGIDAAKAARDAEERRARASRENVDLTRFPELPFDRPGEADYTAARWPKLPRDESKQNEIVYMEPRDVPLPEIGWFPSHPTLSGKLVVMYFWHPDVLTPVGLEVIDNIARQYQRDVVVIGVLTDMDGMSVGGKTVKLMKEQKDVEKLSERMQTAFKNRNFDHYIVVDSGRSVYDAVFKDQQDSVQPLAVLSTDGKARWWGDRPVVAWDSALQTMLREDPGVRARRKVEDQWLQAKKGTPAAK